MDTEERLRQIHLIIMLGGTAFVAILSIFADITFGAFLLRVFLAIVLFYLVGWVSQILVVLALEKNKEEETAGEEAEKEEDTPEEEAPAEDEERPYEDEEYPEDEGF